MHNRWLLLGWLLLRWLLLGWLLTLSKSKNDDCLADFGQVQKQPYNKTPLGETGYLSYFLGYLSMPPALHPSFLDLWRSPPALISTPTGFGGLLFLIVQAFRFFIHPLFLSPLFLPYHASDHKGLPMQPLPRKVKDFPRGCNHSKHMPQLTYLAWLQPYCFNPRLAFMHAKTGKVLLVVKTLIKKHKAAATLISSHESGS